MKKILLALLVLVSPVFAQETSTVQQKIETTIGRLILENANQSSKIENLERQIKTLLAEKDKKECQN